MYNKNQDLVKVRRGNIVYVDFKRNNDSCKQGGIRPAYVISNDKCNKNSSVVTVIPMTSRHKKMYLPTHIDIGKADAEGLKCNSVALIEQIISVDKKDIKKVVGFVKSDMKIREIEIGLSIQCGLYPIE
ncbi:MAG: type II toxin-antitoxin system PemK/MazF family toxin [Lachnospiraceae bacterium]